MKNDGGPAFPRPTTEAGGGSSGMSLRDWFAGQALQGIVATDMWKEVYDDVNCAYDYADAMLAAREAGGGA